MAHRTSTPQAPSPAHLVRLPGLSLATRMVLVALTTDPDAPIARLARELDTDRPTVRRALAAAEAAGVIRYGPSTTAERGPILWAEVVTPPSQGGVESTTPLVAHPPPPGAESTTPTPLPGMASSCREVDQRQGRTPPTPPSISPQPDEPASATTERELREATSKVRRLRRDAGLVTGIAYDRDIGRVLVQVLGQLRREGLTATLDEVAVAAGASLALTTAAVVVTLNRGKVAPPRPHHPSFLTAASVERGNDPDAW